MVLVWLSTVSSRWDFTIPGGSNKVHTYEFPNPQSVEYKLGFYISTIATIFRYEAFLHIFVVFSVYITLCDQTQTIINEVDLGK
jgi:hypothetical protein